MLRGAGTLVTGGEIEEATPLEPPSRSIVGPSIRGGDSRRLAVGDVVIIPAAVPHWWSEIESDVTYLIYRPDPESVLTLQ